MPVEVEEVKKDYSKYSAIIPVCDYGWQGDKTKENDLGHAITLAKEITSSLDLIGQPQTLDLFTKDSVKVTINISDQSKDFNNTQSLFYIKEDLLKYYLNHNDLALIWAIWGEREYSSIEVHKHLRMTDPPKQNYAVFSNVWRLKFT